MLLAASSALLKIFQAYPAGTCLSRDTLVARVLESPDLFCIRGCTDGDEDPDPSTFRGHVARDNSGVKTRKTVVQARLTTWLNSLVESSSIESLGDGTYRVVERRAPSKRPRISPSPEAEDDEVQEVAPPADKFRQDLEERIGEWERLAPQYEKAVIDIRAEIDAIVLADEQKVSLAGGQWTEAFNKASATLDQRKEAMDALSALAAGMSPENLARITKAMDDEKNIVQAHADAALRKVDEHRRATLAEVELNVKKCKERETVIRKLNNTLDCMRGAIADLRFRCQQLK
jgi:hypothetical protein